MTQQNLKKLLKEKTGLLLEYKILTEQVQTSLNQKDGHGLMTGMKARGRLINKINRIDRVLIQSGSNAAPTSGLEEAAAMIGDMQELLRGIASIESQCLHSAREEWAAIKNEILAVRQNKKRSKGYHDTAVPTARFVDTRIE